MLGPGREGRRVPEFLVKREAVRGDQVRVVVQVPAVAPVSKAAQPGREAVRAPAELEPAKWPCQLGAFGPAAAMEAYRCPMWSQAWREEPEGRLAVEEGREEAESAAASRVRKRFMRFWVH